jgi:hypothetical protein
MKYTKDTFMKNERIPMHCHVTAGNVTGISQLQEIR